MDAFVVVRLCARPHGAGQACDEVGNHVTILIRSRHLLCRRLLRREPDLPQRLQLEPAVVRQPSDQVVGSLPRPPESLTNQLEGEIERLKAK